jgi:polysaccharide pyruvyl transferase WcaK-like protein
VGFYGAGNYGDELFLDVFRAELDAPVRLHTLLDPRQRAGSALLLARARDVDAVVVGGGDLVVPWRKGRYWRGPFLERPVFIAGVGVPENSKRGTTTGAIEHLRAFFQHPNVRGISARDPESVDWITRELRPSVPVVGIPDLVCGLDLPAVERLTDPPVFGVAVRHRDPPDDLSEVRRMCERAIALGYRVRRIVLATGRLRPVDLAVTARLGLDGTELVASDDLAAISRAIGECSVLASMKFHGTLVATMYRIPTIVLMPSAKTRRFAARIGRPESVSSFNDPALPDLVPANPALLSAELPDQLRRPVLEHLASLKARILETAVGGYAPR